MRARWGLVFLAASLLTLTGCPDNGGSDDDTGTSGADTSVDGGDTGVGPDTQADGGDTGGDTAGDTGGSDADSGMDVGDQPPTIAFRELAEGDVVTGTVDVRADASDDEEIDSVGLAIDGMDVDTKTEGPYRFAWETDDYDEKKHTLELTATDSAGQTASATVEVTVDRTGPTISITTPTDNQVFVDKVPVKVDVSDNTSISEVTFVVDSQARTESVSSMPFETEFDLSMMSRGLHSVAATAVDAAGLEAKDSVVFELGCMEDDHCSGNKVCVDQSCKELMPQCTQAGQTCDPNSRNPAGQGFACKDTGFGPKCRTTCTVPASGDPAACPSGSVCLGADPGMQGYCVASQCNGVTDTSSCQNVSPGDIFSDFSNGAKCRGFGNSTRLCVPAGSQDVGQVCNATAPVQGLFCEQGQPCNACKTGLACIGGTCSTLCQSTQACSGNAGGSNCVGITDSSVLGGGLGFCDEQCTSFSQNQCSKSGEGCAPLNNSIGYCRKAGSKGFMESCSPPDASNPNRRECQEGMYCLTFQQANSMTGQKEVARCMPRCNPPTGGSPSTEQNDATCGGTAYGRFVKLVQNPSTLDVYVGGMRTVDDLSSGSVTDANPMTTPKEFFGYAAGEKRIDIVNGSDMNNSSPILTTRPLLSSSEVFTWALAPSSVGTQLIEIPVPRDVAAPASGKAVVRVVQTVPDFSGNVDVKIATQGATSLSGATTLTTGLGTGAGNFMEISGGTYDVYVFSSTQSSQTIGNELLKVGGQNIAAGSMSSLYVKGTDATSDSEPLGLVAVPYRKAPDAVDYTCWTNQDNPSPASGICFQECDVSDYGTNHCANSSANGCTPFDGTNYCMPHGSKQPGTSCTPRTQTVYTECAEGAFCEQRGDGSGECASYCIGGSSSNSTLTCGSSRTCTASTGEFGACRIACTPSSNYSDSMTCPMNLQSCFPEVETSPGSYSGAYCSASGSKTSGSSCGGSKSSGQTLLQNCTAGSFCAHDSATEAGPFTDMFVKQTGKTPTCRQSCNPFQSGGSSCPSGQACAVDLFYGGGSASGVCQTKASSVSSSQTLTPCQQSEAGQMCGDHSKCFNNNGTYICIEFCDWNTKSGCSAGTSCQQPQGGPIGGHLGICQ